MTSKVIRHYAAPVKTKGQPRRTGKERAAPLESRPAKGAKRSGPFESFRALCAMGIGGLAGRLELIFQAFPAQPTQMGW
ncbi:MAG: hypothetical protein PVI39_10425, partial [Desulfobacteraceae bacterium]